MYASNYNMCLYVYICIYIYDKSREREIITYDICMMYTVDTHLHTYMYSRIALYTLAFVYITLPEPRGARALGNGMRIATARTPRRSEQMRRRSQVRGKNP